MALISPGVQLTVSDESQYQPTAQGTIAYVLLATAQDKTNPSGSVATGTKLVNAEKVVAVTSQRELTSLFGTPSFTLDASGNPIHADERNEYGLLAAYSALGVANQIYVQRANVDLNQLDGTSVRPTGNPAANTYWFDVSDNTNWGIYEYEQGSGFTLQTPRVITQSSQTTGSGVNTAPITSVGSIGDYAVVATQSVNKVYYKKYDNTWTLVGSDAWKLAHYTLQGNIASPTTAIGQKLLINGIEVTMTGTSATTAASDINSTFTSGNVVATVSTSNQLEIRTYLDTITIAKGTTANVSYVDAAQPLGLIYSNSSTFYGPAVQYSDYRNTPAWRPTDATPRPYAGSVWFKTSAKGNGADWALKKFNGTTLTWDDITAPLYASDADAIYGLDPAGGGSGLAVGTVYVKYDASALTNGANTGSFKPYVKTVSTILKVTGGNTTPTFTSNTSFRMTVSVPGTSTANVANITMSGTTASSFVADVLSANLPNITAAVEDTGAVSISHQAGGTIQFDALSGTPLSDAGLTTASYVQTLISGSRWLASPFASLTYTYSASEPYTDPANDTLWYYNTALEVDLMINDGTSWRGYRTVSSDARGFNLSLTNATGPILSATEPTEQDNGGPLVLGDIWIDTSDLENYPKIYRREYYENTTTPIWVLIDNADDASIDGILFADARWGLNDTTDPVVDTIPSIEDLTTSSYIDPDCPDPRLYPRGCLLWNLRRSGYNVKRFESTWFSTRPWVSGNVPAGYAAGNYPTEKGTWVSQSGLKSDGTPYMGHKAQRNTIVEALKSAIESSVDLREEQVQFNLIACPGYPELIQNMITLNNDRKNTAFIIGDSPLTLNSASASLTAWASNSNLALDNSEDGLVSNNEYLGVYYPSGLATNLDGNSVVVPPSHIMLRTFIRSDDQSYPWFAPAGVRRGVVDNATSIGWVDLNDDNLFRSIGVTEGLRDILYTNKVNPLTVLPGVGLVAYGQKTRATQTSAMDRINVARLVVYLRTVLDRVARPFIFEPNDTITRNQVKQAFESVLNDIVAKRGIYDYLVVCDTTNNTSDRIDRNELWVDIAIEPVKAIEFIYIPVRLKNTGEIDKGL